MSGIKCKCGNYFSTGTDPNPHGFYVVSELSFYEIEAANINKSQFLKLFNESKRLFECPYCKRLVLSNDAAKNGWDFYKLDED